MQRLSFIPVSFRAAAAAASLLAGASISPAQIPTLTTLVEFTGTSGSRPGSEPVAALIQGADGNFYGTTLSGGTNNVGTVFKVTPAGVFTSLHTFTGATGAGVGFYPYAGLSQHSDGMLYGLTNGLFDEGTAGITNAGFGAPFKVSATGTGYTKFFNFSGPGQTNRGRTPKGAMVRASDGNFYGTTEYGGAGSASSMGNGTLFKMTPAGIMEYKIDFSNNGSSNKGRRPNARLVDGNDGFLYGSTLAGGSNDAGTLFKYQVSNGVLTTLAQFTDETGTTPGRSPVDGLLIASDGHLYGTTINGGSLGWGTVFRLTRTGTVTTLVHFTNFTGGAQGAAPLGGLAQGNDGHLYGTTQYGGTSASTDHGTIFRLTLAGVLTPRLIDFTGLTGSYKGRGPVGGLIKGTDGHLYGTTLEGGSGPDKGYGTVFKLNISSPPPLPTVVTGAASAIAGTSATLNGTVHPQAAPTTYQFEYGLTNSYGSVIPLTPGDTTGGNAVENVSANPTGLAPGTLYYFRLKATNAGGTASGNPATFTTTGGSQARPVVVTGAATGIMNDSATLSGTVNPNGAAASWQFEYGLTNNYGSVFPVTPGTTGSGSSPVTVSTTVSGLPPGTLIYYRLKATNSAGDDEGDEATFTTTGTPLPPIVVTGTATVITGNSAVLNGTVDPRGSTASWQFEYGDDVSYGSAVPVSPDMVSGIGEQNVSITLTGLTPGQTVHFHLTATNSASVDPVYGSDRSFTTLFPPVVVTQAAIGITKTNATLVGTVNPKGATTSWQFQYGPDENYGLLAPILSGTTGTGTVPETVSTNLTGLTPGSTWHYRLIATNSAGDAEPGARLTFITKQPPTVTTGSLINLTATGVTLQGTVNPHSYATTWQFDFGTTPAFGSSLPVPAGDAGSGSTPQNVSAVLTGLLPNTEYHYQLRATSLQGTSTTTSAAFTTPNNIAGWRLEHFGTLNNTGTAANTADPDRDGVINQLEYGFGMNPNVRDPHLLPVPSYNGSVLIASFTAPAGRSDVTYGAEVSTNLTNWSPIADSPNGLAHTFSAPFSATGRNWMRLKVILQP